MACPVFAICSWDSGSGRPSATSICQRTRSSPCHELRDGMLDLKAGVDFEEIELAVRTEDELNCASVGIVEQSSDGERCLRHALTQRRGKARRGCLLDNLLVAALNRALTLAEMNQRAVLVAENLKLDMARIYDCAFE